MFGGSGDASLWVPWGACTYRGWKEVLPPKNFTGPKYWGGRDRWNRSGMVRNAERGKVVASASQAAVMMGKARRALGSAGHSLRFVSIACHKDKPESCQFVLGELGVPGEAPHEGR